MLSWIVPRRTFIMVGFACTLVRLFKSVTSGKVSNSELSFSSRKLRSNQKNFGLVSKPENEDNKSRSRIDDQDWRRIFLDHVSKPEIKSQKILTSSWCARLNRRNSHSRLQVEKVTLVDLWPTVSFLSGQNCIRCALSYSTVWSVYSLPIGRSWRNKSLLHYYW